MDEEVLHSALPTLPIASPTQNTGLCVCMCVCRTDLQPPVVLAPCVGLHLTGYQELGGGGSY